MALLVNTPLPLDSSGSGSGEPANEWFAISPSDTVYLPKRVRALYVGGTGDLVIVSATGQQVTIGSAAVGYHPLRPIQIKLTGTTATGLVGLY
jgi:hypothetical protein